MPPRPIPEPLKKNLQALPDVPGVYLFKDKRGVPLYIGKARSIRKRVLSHFQHYGEAFSKEGRLLSQTWRVDPVETATEAEALLLEASLVREQLPRYNQELRDDKSFPFLKITAEEFPRLIVVHGRKADGGKYFGPYTSVGLLRQAVSMLRRLFPMRTCNPLPKKVCLMYHIGQCKGPCEGLVDRAAYMATVKELELFLQGRRDVLVRNLSRRMKDYSQAREYEKAKAVYEEIRALQSVPQGRRAAPGDGDDALALLAKALGLARPPVRIEGFDISNISGKAAVGSMVVFSNGSPDRASYRYFRIRTVQGIDDYEMMREVVRRRYTRVLAEKQPLPDLIVIDGGRGHLSAAKKELDALNLSDVPAIGIAKQLEHLFSPGRVEPHVLPPSSRALQMIRHLRDEAHRFAITRHRRLHRKQAMFSVLESIPGVGPKTRQRLLRVFGSVARMAPLSLEDLRGRGKLSEDLARRVLQALESYQN